MQSKNTQKPIYHVEIGGKKRPVRFGMNGVAVYNEVTNTTLEDFHAKLQAPPHIVAEVQAAQKEGREPVVNWMPPFTGRELIALVYAGLHDGHRKEKKPFDATIEDVGDWIDEAGEDVLPTVFQALNGAQPAEAAASGAEGKGKKPKKQAA